MSKKHIGRCACGSIKFEFDADPDFVAICHCLDCKKASGGEAATWFGVPADDFTVTDGVPKAFGYVADSGGKLDRNFCPNCAARLFTSNLDTFPGMVFVQIGSLEDRPVSSRSWKCLPSGACLGQSRLILPQFENMPS